MGYEAPAAQIFTGPAAVLSDWDGRQRAYLRARVLADGPKATALAMIEGLVAELAPEALADLPAAAVVARERLSLVALNAAALVALRRDDWRAAEDLAGEVVARDHHDLPAQRIVDAARRRSAELTDETDLWLRDRFCSAPFEQIETRTNGAVHFCCSGWQPVPIGDLASGAEAMWNSENAREIRRSILDGDFSHCSRWHCLPIAARHLPRRAEVAAVGGPMAEVVRARATRLAAPPARVILSHDRSCNIACPSCRSDVIQLDHARSRELDTLFDTSLLPLLTEARAIKVTGSGDPFGSRHFRSILRRIPVLAGQRRIQLHTNGLLFDQRAWVELELEGKVDSVWISIDAARPETYAVLRRGGDFAALLRNLDFLGTLRRHDAFNSLRLDFVVQAGNYREMGAFVDLARRVGADGVYFLRLRNWGHLSPARFREIDICDARHPEHGALRDMLADPRLGAANVELGTLARLAPAPLSARP